MPKMIKAFVYTQDKLGKNKEGKELCHRLHDGTTYVKNPRGGGMVKVVIDEKTGKILGQPPKLNKKQRRKVRLQLKNNTTRIPV